MACGIVKDDLMVPVGRTGTLPAWARGAQEKDFTMSMRGMVIVAGSEVVDESPLDGWVALAVEVARSQPPKASRNT
jgi:hypothetical protein